MRLISLAFELAAIAAFIAGIACITLALGGGA